MKLLDWLKIDGNHMTVVDELSNDGKSVEIKLLLYTASFKIDDVDKSIARIENKMHGYKKLLSIKLYEIDIDIDLKKLMPFKNSTKLNAEMFYKAKLGE